MDLQYSVAGPCVRGAERLDVCPVCLALYSHRSASVRHSMELGLRKQCSSSKVTIELLIQSHISAVSLGIPSRPLSCAVHPWHMQIFLFE